MATRSQERMIRWFMVSVIAGALAGTLAAQESPEAWRRASTYAQWREYDRALALLDSIGTDSLAQPLKCRILLMRGKYQKALMEATGIGILWPETSGGRASAWQAAYARERLGQYDDAIAAYRSAASRDTNLAEYAHFRIGRCQYKQRVKPGRKGFPGDAFAPAVQRPANALTDDDSVERMSAQRTGKRPYALKLSASFVKRKRYGKSRKLLADFIRAYPESSFRDEAAFQIGKCWERQGKIREALEAYSRAGTIDRPSRWSDEAVFRLGWCRFKLNDTSNALTAWHALTAGAGDRGCRDAAWYWSAKLMNAQGDSSGARECLAALGKKYPYSFYGLKARGQFDTTAGSGEGLDTASMTAGCPSEEPCPILGDANFQTGMLLASYGLSDDAASVFLRLEDRYWHDGRSLYHLAAAYAACARDERAIDAARRALNLRDGVRPRQLLALIYPRNYLGAIGRQSGGRQPDPAMVLAVIHKESKFDERCRSWVGARGLMQIMPKTGRLLSGDRKFKKDELYDPLLSIRFGVKFLAGMFGEFNRSWPQALAAYNAGPGRVHQWLKDKRSRQDEDYFLEEIFVPETKRYVMAVMENYYIYRQLLLEDGT